MKMSLGTVENKAITCNIMTHNKVYHICMIYSVLWKFYHFLDNF